MAATANQELGCFVHIRTANSTDLPILQTIERVAGQCFRDISMSEIADDPPLPLTELARYQQSGRAWVAANDADSPVAYLLTELVDGNAHVEQVSVHSGSARQGIGKLLLEHLAKWAIGKGIPALTLTTFTLVPWNGPYYERCGFHYLNEAEWTPGLRAIRRQEVLRGLDRWPRACMRKSLVS